MTKTARAVQVPGEPPKAETLPPVEAITTDTGAGEPNAPAEVNDEVAALRAQLAKSEAEKQALAAQVAATNRPPAPRVLKTIGGCELTEKGWIVPANHGAPGAKA